MVLRHFNLREQPFGVTPDPRFLCATATHREALAALLYGIESGLGFVSLIANPGMGKTTILFEAMARLGDTARTVFLFQSIQTPIDLFRALLIDLGEKNPPGNVVDLETRLNEILLEQNKTGKRLVVVLDEAQNLDFAVLEAVRMLSNFETASRKLVQIVLCGQLQLADRLAEPDLLQLRQRISIFACLNSLPKIEVVNYVQHRLKVAGYDTAKPLFTKDALELIARHSRGIPRNINNICFNALTIGCALGKRVLDAEIIREVIGDLRVQKVERSEPITIAEATEERPGIGLPKREDRPGLRVAAIAGVLFVVSVTACVLVLASSGDTARDKLDFDAAVSTPSPLTDAKLQESAPVAAPRQISDPTPVVDQAKAIPPAQSGKTNGSSPAHPVHVNKDTHRKKGAVAPVDRPAIASNKLHLVEARRTQSLSDLCTEQFGRCQPALLNRIIQLNPLIADPNHVKQGNTIIMPDAVTPSEAGSHVPTGG
jgi:general secretion pathway protein A